MDTILDFWFDYANQPKEFYNRAVWWEKNESFDNNLREKFGNIREKAIAGELNDWLNTPKGTLAYIILIDQFSRNMFRNSPKMYQYDHLALAAAKNAIKLGFDKSLSPIERVFIYMPFEHSEQMIDQIESIRLFSDLMDNISDEFKPQAKEYLFYANDHFKVIKQFNRFPHRNKILERRSTPEEEAFLKEHAGY